MFRNLVRFLKTLLAIGVLTCVVHAVSEDTIDNDTTENQDSSDEQTDENIFDDELGTTNSRQELLDAHQERLKKQAKGVLRKSGLNDEEVEEAYASALEIIESVKPLTDEELEALYEARLQLLEEVVPETLGISKAWKTTEHTTTFSIVTTSLAKFYNCPDDKIKSLKNAFERLVNVVPEGGLSDLLSVDTKHYYLILLREFATIHGHMLSLKQDQADLIKIREKELSLNPRAKTRHIDKFVACVDKVNNLKEKEFNKVFKVLTRNLEKAGSSIERLLNHPDERVKKLKIVDVILATFLPQTDKFPNITFKVTNRNCYLDIRVHDTLSDYENQLGENSVD